MRVATPDDAEAIASVHLRSWQTAYRHVLPPAELDALPLEPRVRSWADWLANPRAVAFVGGEPVAGFAYARASDEEPGSGELEALYLLPSAWGTGLGALLLRRIEDGLRDHGFSDALLWVLDDNPRARRFYEREGWRADGGERPWERLGVTVPTVRYRKLLVSEA